jgi:hypothetical protein
MFGKRSGAAHFWRWFEANRERIETMHRDGRMNNGPTPQGRVVLDDLHRELQRYNKLVHPFGGIAEDGMFELIFTTEGNEAGFPAVFELVKAAPKLDRWRFIPLKPRMTVEGIATADSVTLDTCRANFHIDRSHWPASLLLLVDEDPTEDWDLYQFLGQMIVMTVLGEHDFTKGIGECGVVSKRRFVEQWGHDGMPLSELGRTFAPIAVN